MLLHYFTIVLDAFILTNEDCGFLWNCNNLGVLMFTFSKNKYEILLLKYLSKI